ncbi:hypothetical protein LMG22037_00687 [Paraburkholderia phenoliruptrix]|uniref:Uncharacterized protein n=1 Tax=Paraburkholderia phenoliruptrix TaxID=252970 RepID=A0A6J4ZYI0_9BURK|nr:hypothetical protein LMG22037_00687 [Paraburkholderia phenoliruptrix]
MINDDSLPYRERDSLRFKHERSIIDTSRGSYGEFLYNSAVCHPPRFNVLGHLFQPRGAI